MRFQAARLSRPAVGAPRPAAPFAGPVGPSPIGFGPMTQRPASVRALIPATAAGLLLPLDLNELQLRHDHVEDLADLLAHRAEGTPRPPCRRRAPSSVPKARLRRDPQRATTVRTAAAGVERAALARGGLRYARAVVRFALGRVSGGGCRGGGVQAGGPVSPSATAISGSSSASPGCSNARSTLSEDVAKACFFSLAMPGRRAGGAPSTRRRAGGAPSAGRRAGGSKAECWTPPWAARSASQPFQRARDVDHADSRIAIH